MDNTVQNGEVSEMKKGGEVGIAVNVHTTSPNWVASTGRHTWTDSH